MVILGRHDGMRPITLTVSGQGVDGAFSFTVQGEPISAFKSGFLSRQWVMLQIADLLEQVDRVGPKIELTTEIQTLGLEHGIVTPYSSKIVEVPDAKTISGGGPEAASSDERMMLAPGFESIPVFVAIALGLLLRLHRQGVQDHADAARRESAERRHK